MTVTQSALGAGARPAAVPAPAWLRRPGSIGVALVVAVSVGSVLGYAVTALRRIGYPFELQFFEGSTVEVSARVTEGLPLYGPPSTDWTPWPYPPLYFWVTGELAHLTGLNLPTLRAVSFAASLVSLVLLVLIVRSVTGSAVAGLVAAGLFAGTYRVSGAWFDAARVDSLFVMLLLLAVLVALRSRSWRGGLLVGVVLVLAFLTKQNALVVAAPVLVWLLVRRRSVGVAATTVVAVGSVGSVVLGDLLTDGWYSPYVVAQLLGQGAVWRWLVEFWFVDVALPFVVVLAALGWWAMLRVRRGPDRARSFAWLGGDAGLLAAAGTGLLLAALAGRLHDGGYVNVAIPAHVAVALLVGVLAAAVLADPTTSTRLLTGAAALLALQLVVMFSWHAAVVPTSADRAAGEQFVADVRALPERVLIPSHPYYLRLADRPVHASAIAMGDLLATRPGPARDSLATSLPWSLDGVDAVVLDTASDTAWFGPELARDFTLVSSSMVPGDAFVPPTDVATKPSVLYVRTSVLTPEATP